MADRYIVTGAAGFIGSTLSRRLLEGGAEVIGIDCITDYYAERIKRDNLAQLTPHAGFRLVEQNLNSAPLAELLEGAKAVFHLAAQAGVRASWGKTFESYTEHNINATQALLEALKGRGIPIVYSSSSSVYGDAAELPMRENQLPRPHSPYGVTKLAAEHLCGLYWRNFGVPTVSLRYFTVYGPRQRPDMAFHKFIKAALRDEPIHVYGDGHQTRDFTFVEDAVTANILAATKGEPGGVYNIGGGSRVTLLEVLAQLEKVIGKKIKVIGDEVQKGDVRDTFADTSRARKDMGFEPATSLAEGLAREAEWVGAKAELLG